MRYITWQISNTAKEYHGNKCCENILHRCCGHVWKQIDIAIEVMRLCHCCHMLLLSHVVVPSSADMAPASHVRKWKGEGSGIALVLSKGFGNPVGTWVSVWRVGVRVQNGWPHINPYPWAQVRVYPYCYRRVSLRQFSDKVFDNKQWSTAIWSLSLMTPLMPLASHFNMATTIPLSLTQPSSLTIPHHCPPSCSEHLSLNTPQTRRARTSPNTSKGTFSQR